MVGIDRRGVSQYGFNGRFFRSEEVFMGFGWPEVGEISWTIDFRIGSNVYLMYILVRLSSCQRMNSHNLQGRARGRPK